VTLGIVPGSSSPSGSQGLAHVLDATREIRALDPTAVVLFVSADQTVREKVAGVGAAGFIEKPFNLVTLLETIEALVAAAKLAQPPAPG